jgi:hypothetical protein
LNPGVSLAESSLRGRRCPRIKIAHSAADFCFSAAC